MSESATGSVPRTRTPTRTSCWAAEASVKSSSISATRRLAENRNIALQTIHILGKVGDDRYEVDRSDILSTLREKEQTVFTPIPEALTTPRQATNTSSRDSAGGRSSSADRRQSPQPERQQQQRALTPTRFVLKEFQDVPSGLRAYMSSSPSKGPRVIPIKTLHVDVNAPLTLPFDPYRKLNSGAQVISSAPYATGTGIAKELERIGSRYSALFKRCSSAGSGGRAPLAKELLSDDKAFNVPDDANPRKKLEEKKRHEAGLRIAVPQKGRSTCAGVSAPGKPVIDFAPKPVKVGKGFVPSCATCDMSQRRKLVEEERKAREARYEKLMKIRQTPGSV